jgi:hypothetical protein
MTKRPRRKKTKAASRKKARKRVVRTTSAKTRSTRKADLKKAKPAAKARAGKPARRTRSAKAAAPPPGAKGAASRKAAQRIAPAPLASHVLSSRRTKAVAQRGPARGRVLPRRTHPAKRVPTAPRVAGVAVKGAMGPRFAEILTPAALRFLADLHRAFAGAGVEEGAGAPALSRDQISRAGNPDEEEAAAFVIDFAAPEMTTWASRINAHIALKERARGEAAIVRPRGWDVVEADVTIDGAPIAAVLFDVGLCLFHGAGASSPHRFHLSSLEEPGQAQRCNAVFAFALDRLDIPEGTLRVSARIDELLRGSPT